MTGANGDIRLAKRGRQVAARFHKLAEQYGMFMILWSSFEIVVEVAIAKALALSPEDRL
jgi:hypothetical protein